MRRLLLTSLVVVVALVAAGQAAARTVVARDDAGRAITFDMQAQNVDVEWYADILRDVAHGDEIENVTIAIVPWRQIPRRCGSQQAAGCYGGARAPRIVVPAGRGLEIAHTLVHEYGHHIDATVRHGRLREPNGTPRWWAARGMARLVANGRVARDYSLGWDHAIGEIFAEDYAQLHLSAPFGISWLRPPGARILAALRADLQGAPAEPAEPSDLGPLVITRDGTIQPGERRTLPFGLLGPGRRVTFTVRLAGTELSGARARMEVVCEGETIASKEVVAGVARETIDLQDQGPASCEVALVGLADEPLDYAARLRLAVE